MAASSRDYAAEMRAIVNAETASGPYVSRAVAEHVVTKLRATDPDLLDGWLHQQAETFVWQMVNDRDRSMRSHVRSLSRPRAFAEDAAAGDGGLRLVGWLAVPFAVEDGSRVRLAEMHRADLLFVADTYEARAAESKMTAAFCRAIAKKIGARRVGDVYDDAKLTAMWASISGAAA